jgi:hypothetical protein
MNDNRWFKCIGVSEKISIIDTPVNMGIIGGILRDISFELAP